MKTLDFELAKLKRTLRTLEYDIEIMCSEGFIPSSSNPYQKFTSKCGKVKYNPSLHSPFALAQLKQKIKQMENSKRREAFTLIEGGLSENKKKSPPISPFKSNPSLGSLGRDN